VACVVLSFVCEISRDLTHGPASLSEYDKFRGNGHRVLQMSEVSEDLLCSVLSEKYLDIRS
jgi:hypothetical protein